MVKKLLMLLTVLGLSLPCLVHAQNDKAVGKPTTEGAISSWSPYENLHAVIIGINDYQFDGIPDLSYAEQDARRMTQVLSDIYGFSTTLLLGSEATRFNIITALGELSDQSKVGPNDAVIFYFSGHGQTVRAGNGEQGYILPYDAMVDLANTQNAAPYRASAIRMNDLKSDADAIGARHVLFLMDACYSGFLAPKSLGNTPEMRVALSYPARQVITAGARGEEAVEHPALGHGVFTEKVATYLESEKVPFSASKLGSWVKAAVPRELELRGVEKTMTPQAKYLSGEGDFFFIPKGASIAQVDLQRPSSPSPAEPEADIRIRKYDTAVSIELSMALDLPTIQYQAESQRLNVIEGSGYILLEGVGSLGLDVAIFNRGKIIVLMMEELTSPFAMLDDAYDTYTFVMQQIIKPVEPDLPESYGKWRETSTLFHSTNMVFDRHLLPGRGLSGQLGVPPVEVLSARFCAWGKYDPRSTSSQDVIYGQNEEVFEELQSGYDFVEVTSALKPGRQTFTLENGVTFSQFEVFYYPGRGQFMVMDSNRNAVGAPQDVNKSIDDLDYPFMYE